MNTRTFLSFAALAAAGLFAASAARADDSTTTKPARPDGPPPEARAYHERALKIYDANSDGKLDEDERAIMREDIEAGKFPPPPMRGPHGRRGGPLPKEILEQYDADKDGKLSDTERAALEADIKSGKIQPPRGPRGDRRGPPPADDAAAPSNS